MPMIKWNANKIYFDVDIYTENDEVFELGVMNELRMG